MKAFVTSIGENTTDLCIWSLRRNGFEVVLLEDGSTLAQKLSKIYQMADDDFLRVDADVVPNRRITPETLKEFEQPDAWWIQFRCFGWFTQGLIYGGVQFIKKEALPDLRAYVDQFLRAERPETQLSRIPEFYNPRRFVSSNAVVGIHGFKQDDVERVKRTKLARNQYSNYDWELAEKLGEL